MTRSPLSARTRTRRIHRLLVVGLVVVIAAITGVLVHRFAELPFSSAPSHPTPLHRERPGALGEADGVVPDGVGVTVLDDGTPTVARYGSEQEAARWVATAATSPHVSGDAVDIGHPTRDPRMQR